MDEEERAMLKELHECQNEVLNNQYSLEEHAIMKQLEEKKFVQLIWQITPEGLKELL